MSIEYLNSDKDVQLARAMKEIERLTKESQEKDGIIAYERQYKDKYKDLIKRKIVLTEPIDDKDFDNALDKLEIDKAYFKKLKTFKPEDTFYFIKTHGESKSAWFVGQLQDTNEGNKLSHADSHFARINMLKEDLEINNYVFCKQEKEIFDRIDKLWDLVYMYGSYVDFLSGLSNMYPILLSELIERGILIYNEDFTVDEELSRKAFSQSDKEPEAKPIEVIPPKEEFTSEPVVSPVTTRIKPKKKDYSGFNKEDPPDDVPDDTTV